MDSRETFARTLFKTGHYRPALSIFLTLIYDGLESAEIHWFAGTCLIRLNRHNEGIEHFRAACVLDSQSGAAHRNLGIALSTVREYTEAFAVLDCAVKLNPADSRALMGIASCFVMLGQHRKGFKAMRRAVDISPEPATVSHYLQELHYDVRSSARHIYLEHLHWAHVFGRGAGGGKIEQHKRHGRLRVGYVSGDFHQHPVACFLTGVIENHDPSRFHIFCYSNDTYSDKATIRFRNAAGDWRTIAGLECREVLKMIRKDRIDILVDLSGHTLGNRLDVFAQRAAPVQIAHLGYPGTSGLPAIDYRIADRWTVPPGNRTRLFTEKLLRLESGFTTYTPWRGAPAVGPLPADKNGYVTFGSFNHPAKLNDQVIGTWAAVLRRVPGSRLVLKNIAMVNDSQMDGLRARFVRRGIDPGRIITQPPGCIPYFLKAYEMVDIALDTFPWSGHTTACEALWMGVPVITLAGEAHVSRMVFSVLSVLGLGQFAARSTSDYVRIAANVAADLPALRQLRKSMRRRMRTSPLMDHANHAREIEQAYKISWEKSQE